MLAAFKADAKKGGTASFSQERKATGWIASKSPQRQACYGMNGVAKRETPQLDSVNSLFAQPSWATHLQNKISIVTEPQEQLLLREAMLEFSMQNANYTLDFLQPLECRLAHDPFLCSMGRRVFLRWTCMMET